MAAAALPPGGEHRIEHRHDAFGQVRRHLAVILDRFQRLGVAVEPDMAHSGGRDQREQGVDHPQSGAEDRHEADLARQTVSDRLGHGRADGVFGDREIARGFVADEQGDLVDELAEILGARLLGAKHGYLVQDQRMVHHMKFGVRYGSSFRGR